MANSPARPPIPKSAQIAPGVEPNVPTEELKAVQHDPRCETGTLAFADDWPGTFIRGDNAWGYAQSLAWLLRRVRETTDLDAEPNLALANTLYDLQKLEVLLTESQVGLRVPQTRQSPFQHVLRFAECRRPKSAKSPEK